MLRGEVRTTEGIRESLIRPLLTASQLFARSAPSMARALTPPIRPGSSAGSAASSSAGDSHRTEGEAARRQHNRPPGLDTPTDSEQPDDASIHSAVTHHDALTMRPLPRDFYGVRGEVKRMRVHMQLNATSLSIAGVLVRTTAALFARRFCVAQFWTAAVIEILGVLCGIRTSFKFCIHLRQSCQSIDRGMHSHHHLIRTCEHITHGANEGLCPCARVWVERQRASQPKIWFVPSPRP